MKIRIRVLPNSRHEEVAEAGDYFVVKVKEPPKEGKANKALIKVLARYFKVPQGSVRISSGLKGKDKVIEISGR